jgi:hypothetical protein
VTRHATRMIRKSVQRFSEEIMRENQPSAMMICSQIIIAL